MDHELVSTMHKLLEDYSAGEILEALGLALQQYSSAVRMDYHEKDLGGRDYYAETMKVVNAFGADTVLDVMADKLGKDSEQGQKFWDCINRMKNPEDQ